MLWCVVKLQHAATAVLYICAVVSTVIEGGLLVKKLIASLATIVALVVALCVPINGFEIVLPDYSFEEEESITGDVNGDGSVNITDSSLLSRILGGASADAAGNYDVNGDGVLSVTDSSTLKRILAGAAI